MARNSKPMRGGHATGQAKKLGVGPERGTKTKSTKVDATLSAKSGGSLKVGTGAGKQLAKDVRKNAGVSFPKKNPGKK